MASRYTTISDTLLTPYAFDSVLLYIIILILPAHYFSTTACMIRVY